MGYLTPDITPASVTCRALFIPDDEQYLAIVRGALQALIIEENWTKFGTLSPEQAAANFVDMFDRFCLYKESCRMIGEIIPYAGSTNPNDKWLICDGSEILIADYPDLYAIIGSIYGVAGSGNFKLPDFRGRSPSGVGTGSGLSPITLGQMYGEQDHTLIIAEMPGHSHTNSPHSHSEGNAAATAITIGPGAPAPSAIPSVGITGSSSIAIDNTGGDQSHNNLPPRLGINFLIVAKD